MNIATLRSSSIKNKRDLVSYYSEQFPKAFIVAEINEIIKITRNISPGNVIFSKSISTQEVLRFIHNNGLPNDYILSDEMILKLDQVKKIVAEERALHRVAKADKQ
ncbi:MAG TPA: hypothetical protein VF581_07820 [Flavobacterium sp.]|jgi:hypothetical protein